MWPKATRYIKQQVWELRHTVDRKKSWLRKTCETQSKANDRVRQVNENTEKALVHLANIYERFEAANKDLCDIDKRFEGEFDLVEVFSKKVATTLTRWTVLERRNRPWFSPAEEETDIACWPPCDEAESDLNLVLRNLHHLVESTAAE